MGVDMGGSNQFRVSPEHVKALSDELRAVANDVSDFVLNKGHLMVLQRQAGDPVSGDAATAFRTNAEAAMSEAGKFVMNLNDVADNLDGAAKAYQANDANGAARLQNRS